MATIYDDRCINLDLLMIGLWNRIISRVFCASLAVSCAGGAPLAAPGCAAIDYMAMDIADPMASPMQLVLRVAYPDLTFSPDMQSIALAPMPPTDIGHPREVSPAERLAAPQICEQFLYPYPLEFDLDQRTEPYADPGRLRYQPLFEALYFSNANAAEASLVRVSARALGGPDFRVTGKRGVACQLTAVFDALAASGKDYRALFHDAAGGFNWREISGTRRLSVHSFGIAVDLNAGLGQYWKWSGAREGAVGRYDNKIPRDLVETFERYGFIWGGKWHHYDGMHFEFRPEIILYNRISTSPPC